jgi:uncharacterized protein DUF1837
MGWRRLRNEVLPSRTAGSMPIRRGDFGEALTNGILAELEGYTLPIGKLRYKVTANQTLTGTDTLGIKIAERGSISEVSFVESKLRCRPDTFAGVQAYRQLKHDVELALPDIVTFVAARLHDRNDALYEPFADYLASRADTRDIETYRIALSWDTSQWTETVLSNLEAEELHLSPIGVSVCQISDLSNLIDRVYARIGARATDEED